MFIVLAFILLFCNFSNSIKIQEEKLDNVYKDITIYVEVSDYRGNNRVNLALPEGQIENFTKEAYGLSKYLKDISLKRELNILGIGGVEKLESRDPFKLIGITNLNYVEKQYTDVGFDFEAVFSEGLNNGIFTESTDYCFVNEELLANIGKNVGDMISITLITKETVHSARDQYGNLKIQAVEAKLAIAGLIKGGKINEIYCSWDKAAELGRKSDNSGTKYSDILRATISDNYKLNDFKANAKKYYVSVGAKTFSGTSSYGLTVYDDIFVKAVSQIQRNIQFLKAVYPVIILFSFVIGYLVSFLFTRNRKKEVAVMRSLGASKFRVFITIMMELLTINVVGTLIGVLVCYYILNINVTIDEITLFFVSNIFGAALSTIRISSGSVMAIMKDKE
jgi:ABC-type antimicrobial peptide transport system permease subunit